MKHLKTYDSFGKVSQNESFYMNTSICDRCGGDTNGTTTMSIFNLQIVCMKCKENEKKDPEYKAASLEEIKAVRRSDYNYKGAIPNYQPLK